MDRCDGPSKALSELVRLLVGEPRARRGGDVWGPLDGHRAGETLGGGGAGSEGAGKTGRRQCAFEELLTCPLPQPIKSLRWSNLPEPSSGELDDIPI